MTYAMGFAAIKYREGYVAHPLVGVIPKPYTAWRSMSIHAIFPLMLLFSIAWSMELVTHLEELCFWLFLMNAGSQHPDWFQTRYFKLWVGGSMIAVLYMPLVTILSRSDPLKSEAYTFLAGGLGSLFLTIPFMPVLWNFSSFLNHLRGQGVDINTIVRLTKFSELNTIRVVFRLLFTVPLLILGMDGVTPHSNINHSLFWTDILAMLAAFGCAISSGITIVIFFPRSIEGEIAARDAARERKRTRSLGTLNSLFGTRTDMGQARNTSPQAGGTYLLTSSPVKQKFPSDIYDISEEQRIQHADSTDSIRHWIDEERNSPHLSHLAPIRPNRRKGEEVELGGIDFKLKEANMSQHSFGVSNVHPIVHNFTSPIDITYPSRHPYPPHGSWLTFRPV